MGNKVDAVTRQGKIEVKDLLNILNILDDYIVILDTDWRYVYINNNGWDIINLPQKEVLGHTIWKLMPHLSGTKFESTAKQAMESQQLLEIDEYYPHRQMYTHTIFYPSKKFLMIKITDNTELIREQSINDQLLSDMQYAMKVYWSDRNSKFREKHS